MFIELPALALDVRGGREAQLQRRGGDGLQQSLDNQRLQRRARQALTRLGPVIDRLALTTVTQRLPAGLAARSAVTDQHVISAAAADDQAGEHARPASRRREQLAK